MWSVRSSMLGRNVKFLGSVLILVSYFTLILTLCDHNPYVQDTYLVNHMYDVRPAPFLMECVATCHAHSRCQSVGFEPQSLECHRHTHNSSSAPGSLVPTHGWIHSDINMWPKVKQYLDHLTWSNYFSKGHELIFWCVFCSLVTTHLTRSSRLRFKYIFNYSLNLEYTHKRFE